MRRRDREIKEFDEILQVILDCDSLVLGLNDGEFPYLVPLNFGMDIEDGQLYLYFLYHTLMQIALHFQL